jgi:aflatoxin B1 aldehyde reductase
LDAVYDHGYRHLDTGRAYGTSEDRLGEVHAADRFVIDTKVEGGDGQQQAAMIRRSIDTSLEKLGTPTVETMYLHLPDRKTPFEEIAKAMNDAKEQGKFKRFGLSNYTAPEVQRMVDVCEKNGYVKPSVYQGHYNAVVRGGEKELFPILHKHNIAFYAYRYDKSFDTLEESMTNVRIALQRAVSSPPNVLSCRSGGTTV